MVSQKLFLGGREGERGEREGGKGEYTVQEERGEGRGRRIGRERKRENSEICRTSLSCIQLSTVQCKHVKKLLEARERFTQNI